MESVIMDRKALIIEHINERLKELEGEWFFSPTNLGSYFWPYTSLI